MIKIAFAIACVVSMLGFTPGHAQIFHSYVSGNGSGTSCTFAAPCADLQIAVGATYGGGQVSCLAGGPENGNLYNLTVDRSITIDCAGVSAGQYAVLINTPGIVVTLRNLTIGTFGGGGAIGIDFQNGGALFVEHCVIENWHFSPGIGIKFAPPDGVAAELHVSDSVIKNNGLSASGGGIIIQPAGSGSARVTIERTQVKHNTYGIFANGTGSTGNIIVHVKDSVVASSKFGGVSAYTSAGQSVVAITMDRSSSLLNGADGILSQSPNAYVLLSNATVLSNTTGLHSVSGGNILSYQNNTVTGNVSDGAATGILTVK